MAAGWLKAHCHVPRSLAVCEMWPPVLSGAPSEPRDRALILAAAGRRWAARAAR
jgi:hypothetical protein